MRVPNFSLCPPHLRFSIVLACAVAVLPRVNGQPGSSDKKDLVAALRARVIAGLASMQEPLKWHSLLALATAERRTLPEYASQDNWVALRLAGMHPPADPTTASGNELEMSRRAVAVGALQGLLRSPVDQARPDDEANKLIEAVIHWQSFPFITRAELGDTVVLGLLEKARVDQALALHFELGKDARSYPYRSAAVLCRSELIDSVQREQIRSGVLIAVTQGKQNWYDAYRVLVSQEAAYSPEERASAFTALAKAAEADASTDRSDLLMAISRSLASYDPETAAATASASQRMAARFGQPAGRNAQSPNAPEAMARRFFERKADLAAYRAVQLSANDKLAFLIAASETLRDTDEKLSELLAAAALDLSFTNESESNIARLSSLVRWLASRRPGSDLARSYRRLVTDLKHLEATGELCERISLLKRATCGRSLVSIVSAAPEFGLTATDLQGLAGEQAGTWVLIGSIRALSGF